MHGDTDAPDDKPQPAPPAQPLPVPQQPQGDPGDEDSPAAEEVS